MADSTAATTRAYPPVLQNRAVRQFIKFCLVGATSTVITQVIYLSLIGLGLKEVLQGRLAGWPEWQRWADVYELHVPLASSIGFIFGVTNGFIWNSRWTFTRTSDKVKQKKQYVQFFLVNVVGLILNNIIVFIVFHALMRNAGGPADSKHLREAFAASMMATCIVVFWNFFANKHWTFKDSAGH